MQDFEKLGVFYLGKSVDTHKRKTTEDDLLLYDSKNFTTHAVCVGMTGSGKTGLGIAILEEAGIDKIPAIIIDPKGDLGNLLLTFPKMSPQDFEPWVDAAEAERKGESLADYAKEVATTWKEGLAKWGEAPSRIQKLKDSVDMVIYTPASKAGVPLSILSTFAAPSKEFLLDTEAMRDRIMSTTSSLLGLIGLSVDPIKSREHILISTIIEKSWNAGKNLDLATLIQQVQKPSFDKIGALGLDTFFPPKDRLALSVNLNNLLASPGFQGWMEGEPLDIQKLMYAPDGKPKLSIISIAHLSDPERMFFVTLLLNEIIGWMRRQTGTSSLRALLYMDEIFGYFPPTAMPPSKKPMLSLLKQARAFGLGIVLATQNPVDLDYKGLANCGTWFIGKLQTERDKSRVIEGLNAASNGELNTNTLNKMIAATGSRMFIMRSVHMEEPILFQTRWTLSYLRGPLTLAQIKTLTQKTEEPEAPPKTPQMQQATKPVIPSEIEELFVNKAPTVPLAHYKPVVAGIAKLHFVDSKNDLDLWKDVCIIAAPDADGKTVLWEQGEPLPNYKNLFQTKPIANGAFDTLPSGLMQTKNYANFEKSLALFLYQTQEHKLFKASDLNMTSNENESEGDFRARMTLQLREKRDAVVQKLREKYASKVNTLTEKARKAKERMEQKQHESGLKKAETLISVGATILGTLFGRGVTKGTINQAGTSIRKAGRITKDSQSASQAEADYQAAHQQLSDLEVQINQETSEIMTIDPNNIKVETLIVRPKKSDISVDKVALIWWQY